MEMQEAITQSPVESAWANVTLQGDYSAMPGRLYVFRVAGGQDWDTWHVAHGRRDMAPSEWWEAKTLTGEWSVAWRIKQVYGNSHREIVSELDWQPMTAEAFAEMESKTQAGRLRQEVK